MAITHDRAVCLRHREWSETSQTVILLTRRHGVINGLAKGSRREKAPFSGGFELLQTGELGFILKPDKDLATLTEWDLIDPHTPLRNRYAPAVACMFASELTASLLAPHDPHPRVFDALGRLLASATDTDLAADGAEPLTVYLDTLLDDTGQRPDLAEPTPAEATAPAPVMYFDPAHARLVPESPGLHPARDPFSPGAAQQGVWPIRRETVELLHAVGLGADPGAPGHAGSVQWIRAARFLAAWVVYRSGRRPTSLDAFLRITRS